MHAARRAHEDQPLDHAVNDAIGCVEEEIVEPPQHVKDTDPFLGFRISRDTNGVTFHGKVDDIVIGAKSMDRLYTIRYDDGDREHLTAVEVAAAAKNAKISHLVPTSRLVLE